MKVTAVLLAALATTFVVGTLSAQVQEQERPIPRIVQKDERFALFVDDAPLLILSIEDQDLGLESSWPPQHKDWADMEYLHANTVEVPIYWDQIEERPGEFDFSSIDRLLTAAREHNMRLILLWFATWKNGGQHYTRCAGITGFLLADALCASRSMPLSAHTSPSIHAHACCGAQRAVNVEYFYDHARIEKMAFDGALEVTKGLLFPDLSRPGLGLILKEADMQPYRVYNSPG